MRLTYLGHQSWLAQSPQTTLLIDPLLLPTFGHSAAAPCQVYPIRRIHLEAMPPPDAILLTHEHIDHFHLPSLDRLSREVPVFVGGLALDCMVGALSALGFTTIARLSPGTPVVVGDLEICVWSAGHETVFWERRVVQPLLRTIGGSDDTFIAVDATVSRDYIEQIDTGRLAAPRLVVVSNNSQLAPWGARTTHTNALDGGRAREPQAPGLGLLVDLLLRHPAALPADSSFAICGNGFLGAGEANLYGPFLYDNGELACIANALVAPLQQWVWGPRPGECCDVAEPGRIETVSWVSIDEGACEALRKTRDRFLRNPVEPPLEAVLPPRLEVPEPEAEACLSSALPELARGITCAGLGRELARLITYRGVPVGRERLLLRVLRRARRPLHFCLDLPAAGFVDRSAELEGVSLESLQERFPVGVELHLQDFAGLMRGHLQIWELVGMGARCWYPMDCYGGPAAFLLSFYGEQVRPDLAERVYGRVLQDLGRQPPWSAPR